MEKACLFSLVGGLFGNPLAMYMDYPTKALCAGFGVECIATIDASGYIFFPRHMGGNLVLELMAIRVWGFLPFGFVFGQKLEVNSL